MDPLDVLIYTKWDISQCEMMTLLVNDSRPGLLCCGFLLLPADPCSNNRVNCNELTSADMYWSNCYLAANL